MWANIVGILKTSYDHSYNRYILIGEQQKCNLDRKMFVRKIENSYLVTDLRIFNISSKKMKWNERARWQLLIRS
jgi:hypothetical protein